MLDNELEGFKAIADCCNRLMGVERTESRYRQLSRRPEDPLPVRYWSGRVFANTREVAEWCKRQGAPGTKKRAA